MPQPSETLALDLKASLKKPLQWAFAAGLRAAAAVHPRKAQDHP